MDTVDVKIASLEDEIKGYLGEMNATEDKQQRKGLRQLITARSLVLNHYIGQQAGELSFIRYNFLHDFYLIPSDCIIFDLAN